MKFKTNLKLSFLIYFSVLIFSCFARIHKLHIQNDFRRYIALSTFGFYQGGILDVKLKNFHVSFENIDDSLIYPQYGFTLDKTMNDAMNPYLEGHQDTCLLQKHDYNVHDPTIIYFILNLKKEILEVNCTENIKKVHIYKSKSEIPMISRAKRNSMQRVSDTSLFKKPQGEVFDADKINPQPENLCVQKQIKIQKTEKAGINYYSTNFVMFVASEEEEGLYNLYFHNCINYISNSPVLLDFQMEIEEQNTGNYLSAGEMPLPALYFMMSLLFFLSGCFWVFILRKSNNHVFKIHYLMAVLVYLKSLSLFFHAVNFHYIETKGEHIAAWAILFYIAYLLKGAVLIVTIVLIGTGWIFVKPILSEKDKRLFKTVIPLQVLANVAEIIMKESEEGDIDYAAWRHIFVLFDLLCCGCILFPVVWSIRHLQEASQTDGKAAINLRKLKLFRHFYVMVVTYIYFTRIIVYLLKITVPFQYIWLNEMFKEMGTYVFFVLTGYKFRPASANPYFMVTFEDEDDDEEIDIVLTGSGATVGLTKLTPRNTTINTQDDKNEDQVALLNQRENSHEYD